MAGLIHIYCGDGKGKTTASVGLAIRAAGSGKKVIFLQFLKNGASSELKLLKEMDQITTCGRSEFCGFLKNKNEKELKKIKLSYTKLFEETIKKAEKDIDLLVLDEIVAACNHGIIDETQLISFLNNKPENLEVVLTGRNPSEQLLTLADYVTEMKKIKHPFDKGIQARQGVEF